MAGIVRGYAQSGYFTYQDEGKTIITGLTSDGQYARQLVIPATVTTVKSGAFRYADSNLASLRVDNGNPVFEGSVFGSGSSRPLTTIDMGSKMTVANMVALLTNIGPESMQGSVTASGFTRVDGDANPSWSGVTWTGATSVTLPAELVPAPNVQSFGTATVYGRFNIDKEIISFCTNATFEDDGNNNMLFYVADNIADDGRLHIQRVQYIGAGRGVLIHRTENSSGYCVLPRVNGIPSTSGDNALYTSNMLVGVTTDTPIDATDGNKTNYVLKDGAFHPTSGGTIKPNRAYLQIPTSLSRGVALEISFPDEESGIRPTISPSLNGGEWYDLSGRQLNDKPSAKGLYINNGKKYIIR
jgi:hypothetical protein